MLLAVLLIAGQFAVVAHGASHIDGVAVHDDCAWCIADVSNAVPPPSVLSLVVQSVCAERPTADYAAWFTDSTSGRVSIRGPPGIS